MIGLEDLVVPEGVIAQWLCTWLPLYALLTDLVKIWVLVNFLHLFLYSSYLKDPYSPYLSGISIFSTCKEMNMFLEVFFLKLSLVA